MMKDCPKKKCVLSFLSVFAFMMGYETLEYSVWLAPLYQASANIWRPMADMDSLSNWYIIHTAVLAVIITCMYKCFTPCSMGKDAAAPMDMKNCAFKKGVVFGLKIGLLMGVLASRSYVWMPVHMNITMAWFFGALAEGVGIGLVLGFIDGRMKGGDCAVK
jgi:hypothetical protein